MKCTSPLTTDTNSTAYNITYSKPPELGRAQEQGNRQRLLDICYVHRIYCLHWSVLFQPRQMDDPQPRPGRPINYCPDPLFAGQTLSIDGHPIRIINPASFHEGYHRQQLTIADAVATVLWHWHPHALRAFVDRDRFYTCGWSRKTKVGDSRQNVIIERNDRQVVVSELDRYDRRCKTES